MASIGKASYAPPDNQRYPFASPSDEQQDSYSCCALLKSVGSPGSLRSMARLRFRSCNGAARRFSITAGDRGTQHAVATSAWSAEWTMTKSRRQHAQVH